MTVVPEMFDRKASVCATWSAYSDAARQATTMSRKTVAALIAARLRVSWVRELRHGPDVPGTGGTAAGSPASGAPGSLATTVMVGSFHPKLADQHVELLAELVVADLGRNEVDVLRVEQWDERGLLHDRLVDLPPLSV